jgi:two-component system alkaline phosphatase synthesis response regulator PhoP
MTENMQQQILVAEDNAALASVIRFNLVRAGFQVTVANDGRQAWEFVQSNHFDLIVTDQQMPKMTGCELCEKLRSVPEYAELPVIMLTAKGLELELPRLRDELKIMATYMKPFSPKEIVKAVEDCLAATH